MQNLPVIKKAQLIELLSFDLAVQYSLENKCSANLQLVLRAYGYAHDYEDAKQALALLESCKNTL